MSRVMAPAVSDFFEQLHRGAGVNIEFARTVKEFRGDNQVREVICADGYSVKADLCIVGIGILPNSELAESAGLECDNGIVVDEYARTTDPYIYAAGDCTRHPNALLGTSLRLESVHNALEQAKTAAASMCGERLPYAQIPWFWSDQYDVKLQIVGLGNDYDNLVIRGNQAGKAFAAFYLRGNRLLAVDAVNSPREFMLGKKLIATAASFDPKALADESVDFKALATEALENANLPG
jgi:3-phenylpropionate/trans-cinnamate dioxygenase ferredoxin reductase subunit